MIGELHRLVVSQAPEAGAPGHLAPRLLLGRCGLENAVVTSGRDGVLEVAQSAAELAAQLGKAPRAEDEEEQPEDDDKLPDSDSERHGYARNGFTAAVACAAVSAFGNAGAGTIVLPAMFDSTLRWRDSFAPMVAATPFSSFDFSAVTAPR
jgi:hypothetical protein